jgi:hypothetical protein
VNPDDATADRIAADIFAADAVEDDHGLRIRTPDLSRATPPRFAWHGRIVLGYLNLLLGAEGVGKGCLASWIIARLTLGELPGDLHGEPVTVAIVADEDSADDVWTPRLHAAGADLQRIRHIDRADGWSVDLTEDRDRLKVAADLEGVRVLYLDALLDNLGAGVDDWRSKQVRRALQPIRALAAELDIAALGSLHPNKRGDSFRALMSGAVAFNAVSRSGLLLAEHPDDESRRVLVRGKGNLSTSPPAIEFDIEGARFEHHGHTFNVPRAVNFAESLLDVDDLISAPAQPPPAGEARTAAREIIADALADGEWHEAAPIIAACAKREVHERATRRAAKDIGVEHERRGYQGKDGSWWRHRGQAVTSAHAVRGVHGVRSADMALDGTADSTDSHAYTTDSTDTQDKQHTTNGAVRSEPDAELERIVSKFGSGDS